MSTAFTLDDIADAYRVTGLRPTYRRTYDPLGNCGCPLGALVMARGATALPWQTDTICEALGIARDDVAAFVTGFDLPHDIERHTPSPEYYRLGRAARARFLPAEAS